MHICLVPTILNGINNFNIIPQSQSLFSYLVVGFLSLVNYSIYLLVNSFERDIFVYNTLETCKHNFKLYHIVLCIPPNGMSHHCTCDMIIYISVLLLANLSVANILVYWKYP